MSQVFLDTNVLLYAFRTDDAVKQERAMSLLIGGGVIGVQTLNEFANAARNKVRMDWADLRDCLAVVRRRCPTIIGLDEVIHAEGLRIAERYKLSVYDALHIAAALSAECDTLYSEDMHHGLVVDGRLTIANPFAG